MKYENVILIAEAIEDIKKLDSELQKEVFKMLRILDSNIHFGMPLENKFGMDLRNYYKIYFNNAKHRIIYTIVDNKISIKGINESAKVVGVGEREDLNIYKVVHEREENK